MLDSYTEVLDYLYAQLPMYSRIGAAAYKEDLTNTLAIIDILKAPQAGLRCIHVAGTNGKGSTSHMLAAILQSAGYKTGLYTSPHLKDFRERIRVNGQKISEQYIIDFVNRYKHNFESIQPSFFEWTVGLCFDYFRFEQVDFAVIETGLGGRLDSTNVIHPILSVITNIGWDHMDMLGDTLEKIATEKAGIIKQNVPVIIGEHMHETASVFIAKAQQQKAPIEFAEHDWRINSKGQEKGIPIYEAYYKDALYLSDIKPELKGPYQAKNLYSVLASIQLLRNSGIVIEDKDILNGIDNTIQLTGLRGRWDIISRQPLLIADIAHNKNGIQAVLDALQYETYNNLHIIFGMVREKDAHSILKLLPTDATYYFTQPSIPRKLPVEELIKIAKDSGLDGLGYANVNLALKEAKINAKADDMILIFGSNFIIADLDILG